MKANLVPISLVAMLAAWQVGRGLFFPRDQTYLLGVAKETLGATNGDYFLSQRRVETYSYQLCADRYVPEPKTTFRFRLSPRLWLGVPNRLCLLTSLLA
jgi:hypothetical protein